MAFTRFLEIDDDELGLHVRLRRIDDPRYQALVRDSLCIEPDYAFWFYFTRRSSSEEYSLDNLARFYAAFRQTFGESGGWYDDWKGAFNFAFEVQVVKGGETIPYALNVLNFRSGVEFRYCKVIDPEDQSLDRTIIHRPFAEEFSRAQMNVASSYLCGFAEGYWQTTLPQTGEREFLKWVDSNLILFGYRDAEDFQENFEEYAAFQTAKAIRQGVQP